MNGDGAAHSQSLRSSSVSMMSRVDFGHIQHATLPSSPPSRVQRLPEHNGLLRSAASPTSLVFLGIALFLLLGLGRPSIAFAVKSII